MAKDVYKIPAGLNTSYIDAEITLANRDGSVGKAIPVKTLLLYLASIILCVFICMGTFVSRGSVFEIILFVLFWAALTFTLCSADKTGRLNLQLIPVWVEYMKPVNRKVSARRSDQAMPLYRLFGIDHVTEDGLVEWLDGTYGYFYRVVGSASILLFDGDKSMILDRVDAFYRKIGSDCEVGFITNKEAQKVYRQAAILKRRYDNLKTRDPELLECMEEQFYILRNYVGKEFQSIHQYMYIKGDNLESLKTIKNVLQSEAENSSLMVKQCVPLYDMDIYEILRGIYACDK